MGFSDSTNVRPKITRVTVGEVPLSLEELMSDYLESTTRRVTLRPASDGIYMTSTFEVDEYGEVTTDEYGAELYTPSDDTSSADPLGLNVITIMGNRHTLDRLWFFVATGDDDIEMSIIEEGY